MLAAIAIGGASPEVALANPWSPYQGPGEERRVFTVLLESSGAMRLFGGEVLTEGAAHAALQALAHGNPGAAVHVKADRGVPFDRVLAAMALVRRAGFDRVALIAAN